MADYTKAGPTTILTHTAVTHPDTVKGSAQTVNTDLGVTVLCMYATTEAAANTNPGSFLIQVSANTSGDDDWATAVEIVTPTDTGVLDNLDSGGEAIGQTVIGLDDTTGYSPNEWVYIKDTTTVGDSEWRIVQEVDAGNTITILDGLTVAKDDNDDACQIAEVYSVYLDLTAVARIRVVFIHEGATGADCDVKAVMYKGTDIE